MFTVNAASAAAAVKFTNQHFSYHISPDVTIEFLRQKSNSSSSMPAENEATLMAMGAGATATIAAEEEEDVDSYFSPLIYCAITMEEQDEEVDSLSSSSSSSSGKVALSSSKLLAKSNENSSFVCNSADSASSAECGSGGGGGASSNKSRKRFSCHICQKTFGWTTDLKRHILIHTGERPFKCTMCFATFTRNFLLQKHKTKIHQCLSPNEISQLNNNVAKNLMEIKLKMRELEEKAKEGEEIASEQCENENRRSKKKKKSE